MARCKAMAPEQGRWWVASGSEPTRPNAQSLLEALACNVEKRAERSPRRIWENAVLLAGRGLQGRRRAGVKMLAQGPGAGHEAVQVGHAVPQRSRSGDHRDVEAGPRSGVGEHGVSPGVQNRAEP